MRNVECGMARESRSPSDAPLYIPHSALRIPPLLGKALLHHSADQVLGGEMLRVGRAAAVAGEEQRSAGAQGGDVGVRDRRDRLGVLLPDPRRQRRQSGEPRPGLLGGRHSAAACTNACKSAADSSSAVPTTTKSAPAARAARTWAELLIPPPTNNVRSGTAARQARITSADTGRGAPLPASR